MYEFKTSPSPQPMSVVGLDDVVRRVRQVASSKTYRNNAALTVIKILEAADMLKPEVTDA